MDLPKPSGNITGNLTYITVCVDVMQIVTQVPIFTPLHDHHIKSSFRLLGNTIDMKNIRPNNIKMVYKARPNHKLDSYEIFAQMPPGRANSSLFYNGFLYLSHRCDGD